MCNDFENLFFGLLDKKEQIYNERYFKKMKTLLENTHTCFLEI